MKKNRKSALVLAVAFLTAMLLPGCVVDGGGNNNGNQTGGVDFTSHTSYSIRVRNNSGQRLIAFKGELESDRLMGGIQTGGPYGLSRDLFGVQSEGFALILLTESQYLANKSNLKALKDTPFTRIYAFYNGGSPNESIYEISDRLGGNCTIKIQNLSSLDVELRLNGIYGETIGFARSGMLNTTLYVNPADYLIFPVFVKYNAVRNDLITVYPKGATNLPWYKQQQVGEDGITSISFDVTDILQGQTYSTGAAWLIIDNQATDTGVQLQKGDVVQVTPMGNSTINNGYSRTYQIDMAKVTGTNKYAESANIGAYFVGRTGGMINIGNFDLEADKVYKVTVTGSANQGTMVVSAPVFQNMIDISDFTD